MPEVTELEAGSAIMTARGVGDPEAAASASGTFINVGKALERRELDALPERVRAEARAIISVMDGGVEAVRFETAVADATIRSLAEAFAATGAPAMGTSQPVAYGGVTGRVQTLSSRRALRFTLYDTLFDRAVSCYLAEGQEELMRDVWGRMAVVEGLVTRDRQDVPRTAMPAVLRALAALRELDLSLWAENGSPRIAVDRGGHVWLRSEPGSVQTSEGLRPLDEQWLDLIEPFSTSEGTRGPDLQAPKPHLRIVPGKLSGSPHIVSTRIETIAISALRDRGLDVETIHQLYPVVAPVAIAEATDLERQLRANLKAA